MCLYFMNLGDITRMRRLYNHWYTLMFDYMLYIIYISICVCVLSGSTCASNSL